MKSPHTVVASPSARLPAVLQIKSLEGEFNDRSLVGLYGVVDVLLDGIVERVVRACDDAPV